MDLKQVILASCLLAMCTAQIPAYSCGGATNCNSQVYASRGDVMGCVYFCDIDSDVNDLLDKSEIDYAYDQCSLIDGGTVCTETTFVALIMVTLPVCELEAKAIYADWARRGSGPANLLEADDLQALWEACGGSPDASGYVTPEGFAPVFSETWSAAEAAQVPPCDLAYP